MDCDTRFKKYLQIGMISGFIHMLILAFFLLSFGSTHDLIIQETLRKIAVASWVLGTLPIWIGIIDLTLCRMKFVKRP